MPTLWPADSLVRLAVRKGIVPGRMAAAAGGAWAAPENSPAAVPIPFA